MKRASIARAPRRLRGRPARKGGPRLALLASLALALCTLALPAAASAVAPDASGSPWSVQNPLGPQQTMRADLLTVCALDGGTAWVAGAGNALYFSHDGGASWTAQTSGASRESVWRATASLCTSSGPS